MYLYIYTVYVIVEQEMWLLHFIFEGRFFVYYFQNCRKDVTKNNARRKYSDPGGEGDNLSPYLSRGLKKAKKKEKSSKAESLSTE